MVNLDAPPVHYNDARVDSCVGNGWVTVEKRGDDLFVDGRKVIFYMSEFTRKGRIISGHKIREELSGKSVLHGNIMSALMSYPHLIPENWKKDERGISNLIFFWGVVYRNSCYPFVRFMIFLDEANEWRLAVEPLISSWVHHRYNYVAAILEDV
jgi:hypothetical protein